MKANPTVNVRSKNVMGVVVPEVEGESVRKQLDERGYGLIGTSPRIDEAADAYEALVDLIIQAAEVETTMRKLLEDIEKTKRRVNALEYRVIPELKEAANFINFRLEEMERDNISRLKHIKRRGGVR
jgi:V/A-type H+-transporting ATPase subunit D